MGIPFRQAAKIGAYAVKQHLVGRKRYPDACNLLITADGGGSNGTRLRLWKVELQKLADELGLSITVSHLPPGTSKWNRIEHRLFSFITCNWRGSIIWRSSFTVGKRRRMCYACCAMISTGMARCAA